MNTLKVDPEFKALIPPLNVEEYAALKASLQAEGCRDALVIWNDTIIDGHNRYELCQELEIAFQTVTRDFESRDHAIVWIVMNQLARRNIAQYAKDELVITALKPAEERIGLARKKEAPSKSDSNDVLEPSTSLESDLQEDQEKHTEKHSTDENLAEKSGTSPAGIRQSDYISKYAPERVKVAARNNEISRNYAYELTRILREMPANHADQIFVLCFDSMQKVKILERLYKSSGEPETNGTYDEIIANGGFHYGDDLEKWCNFQASSTFNIEAGLKSLAKHHAREQRQARQDKRAEIAQSLPETVFNVIYADPPWSYNNTGVHGAAKGHYDTMPTDDICKLLEQTDLKIADNAVLFMWATNPTLPDAFKVLDAWGFEYKTNMVWVKTELVKPGSGFYVRGRHELLFICTRGSFLPLVDVAPPIGSVVSAPIQEHSRKPDEFYTIIERLYPGCNYVELFARRTRDGWYTWGDDDNLAAAA